MDLIIGAGYLLWMMIFKTPEEALRLFNFAEKILLILFMEIIKHIETKKVKLRTDIKT